MIISQLIGQNQQQAAQEAAEDAQDVQEQASIYDHLIGDPNTPLPLRLAAHKHGMGLLEEHGGKDIQDQLPQFGQMLGNLATQSAIKGAQKQLLAQAQAQGALPPGMPGRPAPTPMTSPLPDWMKGPATPLAGQGTGQGQADPNAPPPGTNLEYWNGPGGASLQTLAGLPRTEAVPPGASLGAGLPAGGTDTGGAIPESGSPSLQTLAGLPQQTRNPLPWRAGLAAAPPSAAPGRARDPRGFREKLADALIGFGGGMTGQYPPGYLADLELRNQQRLQQQRMLALDTALVNGAITPEQHQLGTMEILTGMSSAGRAGAATGPVGEAKDLLWADDILANRSRHTQSEISTAEDIKGKWAQEQEGRAELIKSRKLQTEPLDQASAEFYARQYLMTGKMPAGGVRAWGRGALQEIMAMAPQIAAKEGKTVAQLLADWKDMDAISAALRQQEIQYGQVKNFESTSRKNLDIAIGKARQIADTGSPFFNMPYRTVLSQFKGDPNLPAYQAAIDVARDEIGKVLQGSTGNGALTEGARQQATEILNGNYTLEQLVNVANVLKQDMTNRMSSFEETINGFRERISQGGSPPKTGGGGAGTGGTGGGPIVWERDPFGVPRPKQQ